MTKAEAATRWMEQTAADDSHGYDQVNRWGPDYDCSSAVITAWETNGVPVKSKGATYTGNIYSVFKKCGFEDVTQSVNLATGAGLKRGDVLLNRVHHVAMYCGNGKEVEASINEQGRAIGGLKGDQTGREFLVRRYRNYPWTDVLRFKDADAQAPIKKEKANVAPATFSEVVPTNGVPYRVMVQPLMIRTDADEDNGKILGVLNVSNVVYYYGWYKLDKYGRKWLYVTDFKKTGYVCEKGKDGKKYLAKKEA